jgi:hypothetical protein
MAKKRSRAECRRKLDAVICDLKARRERVAVAETIHNVVRNYGDKRAMIERYPYSCLRIEHGKRGGEYALVNHDHSFKKWAKWVVNLTHPEGHLQHFSLAPTAEDTYCYQEYKRRGPKQAMFAGAGKRKKKR